MLAGSDKRGVCHLKTDFLERPLWQAELNSRGRKPGLSPYLADEVAFALPVTDPNSAAAKVEMLDPRVGSEWDEAVAQFPEATIFHSSAWARVLCDTYGQTPTYLRVGHGAELRALIPLMEVRSPITGCRGVSVPFSDSCAPLFAGGIATDLVGHLCRLGRERKWQYVEVRSGEKSSSVQPNKTYFGHKLDLTKGPNELFDGAASSVRRAIRKAQRSDLSIEIASSEKAVREFYRLHCLTRRRHGVPPQPLAFFLNIHRHIVGSGLGFVATARLNRRPIAAAMFFHFGKNALFKFGASDDRQQELRPNNLVMWEGIRHAAELGLHSLHLGRTDLEHEGLRRFKLSLGAEEEMLHYFRFKPETSRSIPREPHKPSPLAGAICRRLPLTVNRLAGTVLYHHLH